MTIREFFKYHGFKVLIALVVIQLGVVALIQNYDHPPVAFRDAVSVVEGRTVKISPLSNDTDEDEGTELSLVEIDKPANGTFEQKMNLLYYTPNESFVGLDSFKYTISDGKKESLRAYIVVEVLSNEPPTANPDQIMVYEGGSVLIKPLENDIDKEGDSIMIMENTQPFFGSVKHQGRAFTYQSKNKADMDSFRYLIGDWKSSSNMATVKINILKKSDSRYPWFFNDIGNAAIPGSFEKKNGTFILHGSGTDIWEESDGFQYVYQRFNGDFEISVKVDSLVGTNEWAKTGLMARESLTGASKNSFIFVSNRNGTTNQQRIEIGEYTEGGNRFDEVKAPCWLKLKRIGDTYYYYDSPDGKTWRDVGKREFTMSKELYVGLALTSHKNDELAKAQFSNCKLSGKVLK